MSLCPFCILVLPGLSYSSVLLVQVVEGLVKRLADASEELPCKVESALAIQYLLNDQGEKSAFCFFLVLGVQRA